MKTLTLIEQVFQLDSRRRGAALLFLVFTLLKNSYSNQLFHLRRNVNNQLRFTFLVGIMTLINYSQFQHKLFKSIGKCALYFNDKNVVSTIFIILHYKHMVYIDDFLYQKRLFIVLKI